MYFDIYELFLLDSSSVKIIFVFVFCVFILVDEKNIKSLRAIFASRSRLSVLVVWVALRKPFSWDISLLRSQEIFPDVYWYIITDYCSITVLISAPFLT